MGAAWRPPYRTAPFGDQGESSDSRSGNGIEARPGPPTVLDLPALGDWPPDEWGPLDECPRRTRRTSTGLIFSSSNGVDAVSSGLERKLNFSAPNLSRTPPPARV